MTDLKVLDQYINGDEIHIRYTLKSDDISNGKTPFGKPYNDRKGYFDENGRNEETLSEIRVNEICGGYKILLTTQSNDLSEFGISLPINFMGKKNGGGWENQYLLNSPYTSLGNRYKYCYLSNPNGKNLMIFPKGKCDGWKSDYSSEFCPGHFFLELEFLANFDKAYNTKSNNKRLELYLFEVSSFEEALEKMCEALGVSALGFTLSAVKKGGMQTLRVYGDCDTVVVNKKKYFPKEKRVQVCADRYGLIRAVPYYKNKRGMDCVFYCYDDIVKVCKRALDSVNDAELDRTDKNLCEHHCWLSAMLRYMQRYGKRGCGRFFGRIERAFSEIMEQDERKAIPRRTVFNKPYKNEDSYFIFQSNRIQELLFGVTIFTDAYKLTGKKIFLEYAVGGLNSVLSKHFDNGMIYTEFLNGGKEDYTTVCCLIIPFVDMAVLLKDTDTELSEKFTRAVSLIAEYLYNRNGFYTEAFVSEATEEEMEDGSISCTALSLLYYCAKIKKEDKYLQKAKQILDLHEAWISNTPIAPCYHSTLRWWETFWGGDATGPSICFGHAWTIWRAEADYWYYYLTKDENYRIKAYNGFASNFSKIDGKGGMYSCYLLDYIPGGGFHENCIDKIVPVRIGKPEGRDSGLSRYALVRAFDTVIEENFF